jgi:hypothetical protein
MGLDNGEFSGAGWIGTNFTTGFLPRMTIPSCPDSTSQSSRENCVFAW